MDCKSQKGASRRNLKQQYTNEISSLLGMGFRGEGRALSALIRAQGNVEEAASIMRGRKERADRRKQSKRGIVEINRVQFSESGVQITKVEEEEKDASPRDGTRKAEKRADRRGGRRPGRGRRFGRAADKRRAASGGRGRKEEAVVSGEEKDVDMVDVDDQESRRKHDNPKGVKFDYSVFTCDTYTIEKWPEQIKDLYLDGNNMLFVKNEIRTLTLQSMRKGEIALADVCKRFNEKMVSVSKLEKTLLLFDNGHKEVCGNFGSFSVGRSRPQYATTDDHLVEIAQKFDSSEREASIFVTSDRELSQRLHDTGVRVMKPKTFFNFVDHI